MTPNSTFSERVAVLAALDPQTLDNTNATSDYAGLAKYERVAFLISVGNIDTSTTVDAALYEAVNSAGGSAQALTGKALTQLGASGDNQQAVIEVSAAELSAGFTHVACRVTVTGSTATVSVVGLGIDGRLLPASDDNLASVVEIVTD